ncbi:unnamed protein product, partial [Musa textilis]
MQVNDEMQHSGLRAWKWEKGVVAQQQQEQQPQEREREMTFVDAARSRLRRLGLMGQHHVGYWPMRHLYAGPRKRLPPPGSIRWDPHADEVNSCGP